ncbi:cysteine protease inhibitor 7-like [Solanum dulcamara]|uniref:cysteine protease inhibitor 7-like n=1 Tax=Solanum dulcamara TaxID=45834 RepID=UPI00248542F5|nr:cysteine protease inhibitor 7-like [Solanum dulcamara]
MIILQFINNDESTPVLDLDGEPLKIGEEYKILSSPLGGGRVYLADLGNSKCPNGVVQDSSRIPLPGTPVKFFTMKIGGDHLVHENLDVGIIFLTKTSKLCVNENIWKVGDYVIAPNQPPRFVVTGGTLGFPGPNNLKNWFKIEKYEMGRPNSYKLRYCLSKYICPDYNFNCADIGLTTNSGYNCLSLNNSPYPFGFYKLKKNDALLIIPYV